MPNRLQSRGLHVAIIMDGNGRWAGLKGCPRCDGHEAGIEALRKVIKAVPDHGIATLTVYAFSSDNWKRPAEEVAKLMELFSRYLDSETEELVRDGVRLSILGRRDRLPADLVTEIERAEAATQWGDLMHLRVAIDYSARGQILAAAQKAEGRPLSEDDFSQLISADAPEVDLMIRTSGEQRLSDFLLWESAYAELYFTEKLWPDFTGEDLAQAVAAFHTRDRRFGAIAAE